MLAISTSIKDVEELCALEDFCSRIIVAISNFATSVTLFKDIDAIKEAKNVLKDKEKFVQLLLVNKAYYSHYMQRAFRPFLASL